MCCLWVFLRKERGGLTAGWCSVGPDKGDRASACQTQCVCVCVCMCIWVILKEWGSVWDKELLSFLHLFSHSIGVRPPLPGLQSPGLLLWCQHEFASNLQRKNNNNKECVYPAVILCMFSLICWNCVKLTSFKNVWVSKIRQLQGSRLLTPANCFFFLSSNWSEKLLHNLWRKKENVVFYFSQMRIGQQCFFCQ